MKLPSILGYAIFVIFYGLMLGIIICSIYTYYDCVANIPLNWVDALWSEFTPENVIVHPLTFVRIKLVSRGFQLTGKAFQTNQSPNSPNSPNSKQKLSIELIIFNEAVI